MVSEAPHHKPLGGNGKQELEATVSARIAQSDKLLRQIRGWITAGVPLADWPWVSRAALRRALVPSQDENLNTAEWRKVEALRFWIRMDAKDFDCPAPWEIAGDPTEFAYLVDRLRADLASGWDRPQCVR